MANIQSCVEDFCGKVDINKILIIIFIILCNEKGTAIRRYIVLQVKKWMYFCDNNNIHIYIYIREREFSWMSFMGQQCNLPLLLSVLTGLFFHPGSSSIPSTTSHLPLKN